MIVVTMEMTNDVNIPLSYQNNSSDDPGARTTCHVRVMRLSPSHQNEFLLVFYDPVNKIQTMFFLNQLKYVAK